MKADSLFASSSTVPAGAGSPMVFKHDDIGDLHCPSGIVYAGDVLLLRDMKPFNAKLTPGEFKVYISLVDNQCGVPALAYVTLCILPGIPIEWIAAEPKHYRGDNSIACFADKTSADLWENCLSSEGEVAAWTRLSKEIEESPHKLCCDFKINEGSNANLIAWSSSTDCAGRLCYGLNHQKQVVSICVDTGLLPPLVA